MESSAAIPTAHPLQENGDNAVIGNSSGGGGEGLAQVAMSMIAGGGGAAMSAPVPDVLLSLAKDDRYISEVVSLLSQVAVPFASIFLLPGRWRGDNGRNTGSDASAIPTSRLGSENSNDDEILEDDGRRFIERIRPELNLLASIIVHSATFVFYTRNFGGITEGNNQSIQRSLGMESLNLAYQYPVKKQIDPTSSTKTSMDARSISKTKRLRDRLVMKFPSLKVNPWHRLIFLQTIVPYIIQRVGRGGWERDLGGLLSAVLDRFGLASITSHVGRSRTINNDSETEQTREDPDAVRNDDRLRGSARRRLFEEQRRRMLISSNATSQVDASGIPGGNSEDSNIMSDHDTMQQSSRSPQRNNLFDRRLRMISKVSWSMIKRMSLAVSSLSHGAHSLPRHTSSAADDSLDRYAKIIKWFLRLHLALFYWNGIYPTVAHRLAGAKLRDSITPYSTGSSNISGTIVANRPTYKPIAALILFQAFASFAQTAAEASIEVAHSIQIAFFRWRRRRRMQNEQINGSITQVRNGSSVNRTNSERAEYMELIEERVPGIASANNDARKSIHKSPAKKSKQQEISSSESHPCGICLNERVHPAAPSVCGHVFCWNCILHWVSNVRAECPLCRAQTRPQEIIPLYNYP